MERPGFFSLPRPFFLPDSYDIRHDMSKKLSDAAIRSRVLSALCTRYCDDPAKHKATTNRKYVVAVLTALQWSHIEIASVLNVSPEVIIDKYGNELDRGRQVVTSELAMAAVQAAMQGEGGMMRMVLDRLGTLPDKQVAPPPGSTDQSVGKLSDKDSLKALRGGVDEKAAKKILTLKAANSTRH